MFVVQFYLLYLYLSIFIIYIYIFIVSTNTDIFIFIVSTNTDGIFTFPCHYLVSLSIFTCTYYNFHEYVHIFLSFLSDLYRVQILADDLITCNVLSVQPILDESNL